jgi:hypothetical protein
MAILPPQSYDRLFSESSVVYVCCSLRATVPHRRYPIECDWADMARER